MASDDVWQTIAQDSLIATLEDRQPWWREAAGSLFPAIVVVLVMNLFMAQPRVVHGQSMEPNLHDNQRVIVDMVTLRLREPERGEIIILDVPSRHEGPPLIKRVIGLPGDIVEIKGGRVYINDDPLDEPYLSQITMGNMVAQMVPEEHVFVLGDNRRHSNDSRYFGTVPYDHVLGRAWLCYWPLADAGFFHGVDATDE
jgi:signal peptidase I